MLDARSKYPFFLRNALRLTRFGTESPRACEKEEKNPVFGQRKYFEVSEYFRLYFKFNFTLQVWSSFTEQTKKMTHAFPNIRELKSLLMKRFYLVLLDCVQKHYGQALCSCNYDQVVWADVF